MVVTSASTAWLERSIFYSRACSNRGIQDRVQEVPAKCGLAGEYRERKQGDFQQYQRDNGVSVSERETGPPPF
jgi:hypothetical protein